MFVKKFYILFLRLVRFILHFPTVQLIFLNDFEKFKEIFFVFVFSCLSLPQGKGNQALEVRGRDDMEFSPDILTSLHFLLCI